ncbi:hypothetical protein P3T39_003425 [Kitasatospora sp. GP82]|nr:hypothetical protein [Kitasatospora sp. GP82]
MTRLQRWSVGLWLVLMLAGGSLTLAMQDGSSGERFHWEPSAPTRSPDPCPARLPSPAPTGTHLVICAASTTEPSH